MATEAEKKRSTAYTACAITLEELSKTVFTPGCKLTLLMRHPDNDDCNMLVTDDDIDEIVRIIHKLQVEERDG